jgi:hypothetical protein
MESTKKLGYLRWNTHCSYLDASVSIGLPLDEVCREEGLTWMEPTEKLGYLA